MEQIYPYLPGFAAVFSIQAVAVASPGPSVALILGLALSHGRLAAMIASLGIASGSACIALATTQGPGLLMERVVWLSIVIRIAGVGCPGTGAGHGNPRLFCCETVRGG